MDKLNALAMFVATAETGSFSRGAERLGKTPSALTKAVAHLEAELGARLFERTTRSLALTEAGQIYLEAARQSLETLRTAGQEIELLESELRGELRLAAPPSFAAAFLQQACASFLEAHPRISLRVDLDETFLDLSEGGYDLGLRDGPIDLPGLVARPLAPNQIVLCASPAYLARQPAPQGPEDFERHAWLVFQHPSLNQNFWWMERDGARQRIDQPRPRLASDNYDFLLAHLLAGLGLVLSAVECRAAARRRAVGAPARRLPLRPGAVRALHPCPLSGAPAQHAEGPRVPRAPARQLAATGAVPSAVTLRLRVERIRSDCRKNLCCQAFALWFGKCPAGL